MTDETQDALAESEQLYRTLIETTGTGYVVLDGRGRVLDANPEYVRLTGHSELGQIRGRSVVEWTAEHEKEKNAQAVDLCARLGHVRNLEIDYVDSEGGVRRVEINATTVGSGDSLRILALCREITERKRAEDALRSSEEMFRRLIEGAPDAVFVQTRGLFTYVNAACCRMLGARSPEELLGTPIFDRIHPDYHAMVRERVRYINQDKKRNPPLEEVYVRLDGVPVPVEVSAVPVVFQGENGALVFVRDITDKQLTDEALRSGQKLEAIGVLAGGIAHDFNNLLGGAFGHVELAHLHLTRGDAQRALANLASAAEVFDRARSLTRQLLTFAKGGTPVRSTVALTPLLLNGVKFALSGSAVESRFELPDDLWPCHIDEHQIGQVVDNIVINALQAMPAGGVLSVGAQNLSIDHGTHPALSKGRYVRIAIADTGIGIPKTIVPRIFDPFFTTKQKGSGLGLATSYSIIKRHGGAIDVESEPGRGTTFWVYLPACAAVLAEPAATGTRPFQGRGRILIMDDEEFIRESSAQMAELLGFAVLTAAHGDEALRVAKEAKASGRPIAVAILDLTVPGGRGGRDVARELLEVDPATKLIVSTGYSDDPLMANPGEHGFVARLPKPYRLEELAAVLQAVLGC